MARRGVSPGERYCTATTVEQFREFMIELAVACGEYIRPHFRDRGLAVEHKEDRSTVAEADRGGERVIREMIADRYPDHGVIGEEYGEDNPDAELVWVSDPIDGTDSFITGVPFWGTLIALMHDGEPILGCIHQPVLGQLLIGDGEKATLNGATVVVRDTDRLESATLLYSNPVTADANQNGPALEALVRRCNRARTWGDCYGYLLLAGGWADIMCDPIMNLGISPPSSQSSEEQEGQSPTGQAVTRFGHHPPSPPHPLCTPMYWPRWTPDTRLARLSRSRFASASAGLPRSWVSRPYPGCFNEGGATL